MMKKKRIKLYPIEKGFMILELAELKKHHKSQLSKSVTLIPIDLTIVESGGKKHA